MRMRLFLIFVIVFLLSSVVPALADDQEDEPGIDQFAPERGEKKGIDYGLYLSGGKTARLIQLDRTNHVLAAGGVDPFTGFVDDWVVELGFSGPRTGHFDLAMSWWDQQTGGDPIDAKLSGWELLARWGAPVAQNRITQIYPILGIGYARRTLEISGPLNALGLGDLSRGRGVDLVQSGMLLEAGLRLETYAAWPKESKASFLSVQAIGLGWQGVPIASAWRDGDNDVHGIPDDLIHTFYLRFNIGFGLGGREARSGDEDI